MKIRMGVGFAGWPFGRTQRIKFGMSVAVLPVRDPLVLAKELATIDFLSDGRLLPAFGLGVDSEANPRIDND